MKDKLKTLVILTPGFPKNELDTTCLPFQQQLIKTIHNSHPSLQIIILSFQYPFTVLEYDWHGIPVISFGGQNKGGWKRWLLWQQVKKRLSLIKNEYDIAGILSFWCGECALVGKKFANKHQLKHYCWILGQDAKKNNTYFKRIQPVATELIALSDFIQEQVLKNHGRKPAHIIPPGIEPLLYIKKENSRTIDILAAGSLIPLKQYDVFIDVIQNIKKEFPFIRAAICGDGPERARLEKEIERSGLNNNILLTGELPHHEVIALMQQSKIFLHPSQYEGFGVVCLEALNAGADVISFVRPMQKSIPNWIIVDTKNEMEEKVKQLLHNNQLPIPSLEFPIKKSAEKVMSLFGL